MKNLISQWVKSCLANNIHYIFFYLLLGACISSCTHQAKPEEHRETFVLSDTMMSKIKIDTTQMLVVASQIKLLGKVMPDENKYVQVFPLVGGNVESVNVELGDYVQKGEILAVIRSGEVADFERQLIDAQSDLLVAQKNLKVSQDLYSSKLASEKDVIANSKEVEKAQAELKRVQEIFQIYSINSKAEYQVKAPISGFVTEKKINRDMQLRSDKSDNIFTIAEIADVWVNANVYETDISRVELNMPAEVTTLSYPDTVFNGKVDKIYNMLDPETRTMKIRIMLHNNNYLLKPEMNATITLKYDEPRVMIAVPSASVIFDKNKNFVIVFRDKYNVETREVLVYKQVGNITYISKGLKEGEKVISKNQLLIYNALNEL